LGEADEETTVRTSPLIAVLIADVILNLLSLYHHAVTDGFIAARITLLLALIAFVHRGQIYGERGGHGLCPALYTATLLLSVSAPLFVLLKLLGVAIYHTPASLVVLLIAPLAARPSTSWNSNLFSLLAVLVAPYTLAGLVLTHLLNTRHVNNARRDTIYIEVGEKIAELVYAKHRIHRRLKKFKPKWMEDYAGIASEKWVWAKRRGIFGIEFTAKKGSHVLIAGATGSGKTATAKTIIKRLTHRYGDKVKIVVIDPHGEYGDVCEDKTNSLTLKAGMAALNPLQPPPAIPPQLHAANVTMLFRSLFQLGPVQQNILYSAILQAFLDKGIDLERPLQGSRDVPSLYDVQRILRELSKEEPKALNVLMYINMFINYFSATNLVNLEDALRNNRCIIFDLTLLTSKELRFLYVDTLLKHFYAVMISNKKEKGDTLYMLVVDEAHTFADRTMPSPYLVKVFTELRKYGVAAIAITQQASRLHREIAANASYVLALRHIEPGEVRYMASMLSGVDDETRIRIIEYTLSVLPRGNIVTRERDRGRILLVKKT